jgi:chloramphenicol 3-O-phosphotransferase
MSQIVILSGPSGAGKTGVAEALCERYDRTVHLETDLFYGALRMGALHPMHARARRQNVMVSRAVARAASAYAQDLFAVFIDGVIGRELLAVYLEELDGAGVPVHFVLLLPSLEETMRRSGDRARNPALAEDDHRRLYEMFTQMPGFAGCTIDNSGMSALETADLVMEACGRGDCLVAGAPRQD